MFSFNKASSAGAGSTTSNGLFGQKASNTGGGFSFGQNSGTSGTGTATGGFSFGGQNATQGADSKGGLFGSKPAGASGGTGFSFGSQQQQPQQLAGTTGLFGNSNTNTGSSGLFGTGNSGTAGATSGSGGLFGTGNSGATGGSGGLFGNTGSTTGSTGGGLFGSKPAGTASTSLFGQSNSTNQGGLLGNSGGNSLFGNSSNTGGGLFGSKPAGTSLFGNNTTTNTSGSLFGAQQPLQYQQQSALQAISQLPVTPMTKVSDLPPQLRQEIEQLDQYIQRQVQISQHLKADTAEHKELIDSIPRDIAYLLKTESLATQSLAQDLKKIASIKETTDRSIADTQTFSMILQQLLTPGSKISSMELDKFFHHRIQTYQDKLDDYFRVLSDIESAVNGIDTDVFGRHSDNKGFKRANESSDYVDVYAMKTGINALISTVIEEFSLFMDTAERVAQIHQKVKEISFNESNKV